MNTQDLLKQFAKQSEQSKIRQTGNCVIYTRVSTREQADNNMSLATQKKACEAFAIKNNLQVLGHFGGTYESAKTDERKEFKRMLDFVKRSKLRVSQIVVYSVDRFSRSGANAIYIASELKKEGIVVQAVTQPADTSTPAGALQQNIQFIFSEYDNQLRRQKCMAGMKEKALRGEWGTRPPLGYDMRREGKKQVLSINKTGKLLLKAFEWKASENITNMQVLDRLKVHGLVIRPQHLQRIFKNVFYCGYISHLSLEGEIVKGNHPPLISEELFLKVNNVVKNNHIGGWTQNHEKEEYPLKVFLKDAETKRSFTGYVVAKKKLHYYKMYFNGRGINKRTDEMHKKFANFLSEYEVKPEMQAPLEQLLDDVSVELTKNSAESVESLSQRQKELRAKLLRLDERYIEEELPKELYERFKAKYREELVQVDVQIEQAATMTSSNLSRFLHMGLGIASSVARAWVSGTLELKRRLQLLVFPEGLYYDAETDQFLTPRVNSIFELIRLSSMALAASGNSKSDRRAALRHLVESEGFEPPTYCV